MEFLALLISIIALLVAYSAYRKSGGSTDELKSKIEDLGITTENLRVKTADTLSRLEKAVRGENRKAKEPDKSNSEKTDEEDAKK